MHLFSRFSYFFLQRFLINTFFGFINRDIIGIFATFFASIINQILNVYCLFSFGINRNYSCCYFLYYFFFFLWFHQSPFAPPKTSISYLFFCSYCVYEHFTRNF